MQQKFIFTFLRKLSNNLFMNNRLKFYICTGIQIHSGSYRKDERILTLKDYLNLSYKDARALVINNESLHKLQSNHLKNVASVLSEIGITHEEIRKYPDILTLTPSVLRSRAMVLQESGFTRIDAQILMRFLHIITMKISILKAHGLLNPNDDKNIIERLLSWVRSPPCVVESFDNSSTTFKYAHAVAMKHYLTWRLQMSEEECIKVFKARQMTRCRSMRLVEQSLDVLEKEYNFTPEKIRSNKYLIDCDPENISEMLQTVSPLNNEPLENIAKSEPKLLMKNSSDVAKILMHIQEFEITPEAVQKCPEIFNLSADKVRQRLVHLSSFPEFKVLKYHPKVLKLVLSLHKTNVRLKYLQQINHDPTLELLCCRLSDFERILRDGVSRRQGLDLLNYFSKQFSKPTSDLKTILNKHPYWTQVSVISIDATLNFLFHENFSHDDIFKNIHLVLYPKEKVQEELRKLDTQPEIVNGQKFGICVGNLTPRQRLALCLYYIEREHHFTGNGVWCTTSGAHIHHTV